MSQLKLNHLSLRYGDKEILKDVTMTCRSGEITVITGESGSGKSSLLKLLNGIIPTFQSATISGQVDYEGNSLLTMDMVSRSQFIATVFQNPKRQFYAINSSDEIAFALENRNTPPYIMRETIARVSKSLGTEALLNRDIFSLSGGQKQLMAITSVACMDTDIYLFDEPSASLDREAIDHFTQILCHLKAMGKLIIIVEHRLYYLKEIMDQLVILKDGQSHRYLPHQLTTELVKHYKLRRLTAIKQSELACDRPYQKISLISKEKTKEDAVLQCRHYTYRYHRKDDNLFDCQMTFSSGITFIIGRNGIGKSTFLRSLAGLTKRFKGKTFYKNQPLKPTYDWISMVKQDVHYQLVSESVWSEIGLVSDNKTFKEETLKKFQLSELKHRHPQSLSGGEKQRLLLAMAKASEKPIIILDEPTSGLCKCHMTQLIAELQEMANEGKTILITTHDYELIQHCPGQIIEFVK